MIIKETMHRIQTGLRQVKYEVLSMVFHFFLFYTCLFFSTLLFDTQNLPKSGLSLSSLILMWQKNFASMLHYLTLFQQYAFYWYYSNVLGKSTQWFLQPVQILLLCIFFLLPDQPCKKCLLFLWYLFFSKFDTTTSCRHK